MGFIQGAEQRGTAADTFRRIYWDTALSASNPVFRLLRDVVGIDQVLFGTDFPYLRRDLAVSAKQRLLGSSELSHLEKHAILGAMRAAFSPVCSPWIKVRVTTKGDEAEDSPAHSSQRGRIARAVRHIATDGSVFRSLGLGAELHFEVSRRDIHVLVHLAIRQALGKVVDQTASIRDVRKHDNIASSLLWPPVTAWSRLFQPGHCGLAVGRRRSSAISELRRCKGLIRSRCQPEPVLQLSEARGFINCIPAGINLVHAPDCLFWQWVFC
jgi:hypothetical protein